MTYLAQLGKVTTFVCLSQLGMVRLLRLAEIISAMTVISAVTDGCQNEKWRHPQGRRHKANGRSFAIGKRLHLDHGLQGGRPVRHIKRMFVKFVRRIEQSTTLRHIDKLGFDQVGQALLIGYLFCGKLGVKGTSC